MPLTEFVFKIRSDKNLLCDFTRQHKNSEVVIHLMRRDAEGDIPEALYTILAPRAAWQDLLQHFPKEYGTFRSVVAKDDYTSVQAPLNLDYTKGHSPIDAVIEMLGPDCWFAPIIVKEGYLHISVVSPSVEGRENFMAYTKRMRAHVSPDDFKLLHVGPYAPPALAGIREGLTPGQDEVVKMAVALGYYDTPRGCTLQDLAEAFGVSKAAAHKRLKAAENKIVHEFASGKR